MSSARLLPGFRFLLVCMARGWCCRNLSVVGSLSLQPKGDYLNSVRAPITSQLVYPQNHPISLVSFPLCCQWTFMGTKNEFEQTPGDSEGQGRLACWNPWGRTQVSENSNNTGTNRMLSFSCWRRSRGSHLFGGRLCSRHLSSVMSGCALSKLTPCSTLVPSMGTYTHAHIWSLFPERTMLILPISSPLAWNTRPSTPSCGFWRVGSEAFPDQASCRLAHPCTPCWSWSYPLTCLFISLICRYQGGENYVFSKFPVPCVPSTCLLQWKCVLILDSSPWWQVTEVPGLNFICIEFLRHMLITSCFLTKKLQWPFILCWAYEW